MDVPVYVWTSVQTANLKFHVYNCHPEWVMGWTIMEEELKKREYPLDIFSLKRDNTG